MDIYLTSCYLAPVQYYSKLITGCNFYIDQHQNYIKQSYRNRCSIIGSNGIINLSIPIEHSSERQKIKDIKIAQHGNWQHLHWNAIKSAYGSSPFFEYYQDDFEPFYRKKFTYLFELNESLSQIIQELIGFNNINIKYTDYYKETFNDNELDYRNRISPKFNLLESDPLYKSVNYYQVFEDKFGFIENMSILDLLFNMGNESILILNKSHHQ